MNTVTSFDDFISEGILSSVTSFLKAQYNNIFKGANQQLNNLFVTFTKKVDTEKNTSNLYQRFIRANQTTLQNELNNAESIDAVNKLIADNIKYFYFSLKPVVNKLQDDEFTIKKIFERSRDKRLMTLMSYPEDQFSNAVQQYVNDGVLPWIKKDAGLDKEEDKQQTQQPAQQTQPAANESIMNNIYRILEADTQPAATTDDDLTKYKKSTIKWFNTSLYDLIKYKMQILTKLGSPNIGNVVDQTSKMMKGTNNENAKKMILNKIINMDKLELQNLTKTLGLTEDELGQL